jgi:hypothetical protein
MIIEYLKESTFASKEVILQAWKVTRDNYFSIATFCFLIFITASTSTFMAFFMEELHIGIRIIMLIIFALIYCVLQLCLIKYIFSLLDKNDSDIRIIETLPTRLQVIRFLVGTAYLGISIVLILMLLMPILYVIDLILKFFVHQGVIDDYKHIGKIIVNIAYYLALLSGFLIFIRVIFFPFFIIDKQCPAFESLKLSLATTKGNFIKLLVILGSLAVIQYAVYKFFEIVLIMSFRLINLLFDYDINQYVSILAIIFTSFAIVPFTTSFTTIAYRKIMSEYKGDEHPDIIHNIV